MEFLEFLEQAQQYIPAQYAAVSQGLDLVFPYLFLLFSALICFMGLKLHRIWLACLFFVIGFLVGALSGIFFPDTWSIYIFIGFGLILGVLAAYFSHKLYGLQLFLMNALLVFSTLPDLLAPYLPGAARMIVSVIAAIAVGLIAMKYKHLVTIVTTAFTGAVNIASAVLHLLAKQSLLWLVVIAAVFTVAGIIVQFLGEKRRRAHEAASKPTA